MAKTRRSTRAERRAAARERARARTRARVRRRRRLDRIPRPLRSPLVWGLVIVLVASTVGYGMWQRSRPVTLASIGGPPGPVPLSPVTNYRVVYKITDTAGNEPLTKTEVVEVRRPFEERVETRNGEPPGGPVELATITNREFLWNLKAGEEVNFAMRRQPGVAHRDATILALREAAKAGVVRERGTREVKGEACTVFAYKEPRPQPLEPPGEDDWVESCVSDDGIVLHEVWTIAGRTAITKETHELDLDADIPDDRLFVGRQPEDEPNYETFKVLLDTQSVTEDAKPDRAPLEPELPDGYRQDRAALNFESGGGAAAPRNSYYQSFVRNEREVVILDQGVLTAERPPWTSEEGQEINIGERFEARVVHYEDRVELRRWRTDEQAFATHFYRVQAPTRDLALWFMLTLR